MQEGFLVFGESSSGLSAQPFFSTRLPSVSAICTASRLSFFLHLSIPVRQSLAFSEHGFWTRIPESVTFSGTQYLATSASMSKQLSNIISHAALAPVFVLSRGLSLAAIYNNGFVNVYPMDVDMNAAATRGGGFFFDVLGKVSFLLAMALFIAICMAWIRGSSSRERLVFTIGSTALFVGLFLVANSIPTPGSSGLRHNLVYMIELRNRLPGSAGDAYGTAHWFTMIMRGILTLGLAVLLVELCKSRGWKPFRPKLAR